MTALLQIMINGMDHIFCRTGWTTAGTGSELFDSVENYRMSFSRLWRGVTEVVNEASPIVDARLNNGSRVNIVMNPIALNGPIVTIRRFSDKPITMQS